MEVPDISILSVIMILIPFSTFIEQVHSNNLENIGDVLFDREKYWQSQLFTIAKGMNNILDLCSSKIKDCRKH